MWRHKKISVILPTFNEKRSIKKVIQDFTRLKLIDEILVINNNATPGTTDEVKKTDAVEIFEPIQGYGSAIRCGLKKAKGQYIILCEPDGTFLASDIYKFLSYSDNFDFVIGTRTTNSLIWHGANMGLFLKWGNYILAKITEFSFNTTQLTDAGCTYRLIKRKTLKKIQNQFKGLGNDFGLEMIILAVKNNIKFIQIPVNYKKRIGQSSVTGNKLKALILGIQMFWLILQKRFSE